VLLDQTRDLRLASADRFLTTGHPPEPLPPGTLVPFGLTTWLFIV
jgi:hypothetical protein